MKFINLLLGFITRECVADFGSNQSHMNHCHAEDNITWICNFLPANIPVGYPRVRIIDFQTDAKVVFQVNTFRDESWTHVEFLELRDDRSLKLLGCEFHSKCFSGAKHLRSLKLSFRYMNIDWFMTHDVFAGLPFVKRLDMTNCPRLIFTEFMGQLDSAVILPGLQELVMRGMGLFIAGQYPMDFTFFKSLGSRNITLFDAGEIRISTFNVTAFLKELPYVKNVNMSYAHYGYIIHDNILKSDVDGIENVDISYISLPSSFVSLLPGKITISDIYLKYSQLEFQHFEMLLKPKIINASGIVPQASPSTFIWLHNISLEVDKPLDFSIKHLYSRNNRLNYVDVFIICEKYKMSNLTVVDISSNGIRMLNPSILACASSLESVNLSNNELLWMFLNKPLLFEQLFFNLTRLRLVTLSNNNLTDLPQSIFQANRNLKYIDLSENNFHQIHFSLSNMERLETVNLEYNDIRALDAKSIANVNNIPTVKHVSEDQAIGKPRLLLKNNPLDCSTCETKEFVAWVLDTSHVQVLPENLTCRNADGKSVVMDLTVLQDLETLCRRPIIIRSAFIALGCVAVATIILGTIVLRHRRRAKKNQHRLGVIRELQKGDGCYEFVVFLSYCSKDDDFVSQHILNQLNDHLQQMTRIRRNLVCSGDLYLRPGFNVHDETIRCLQRIFVVVVVVSKDFLNSPYCQTEFDQAIVHNKPTVLMLKDYVDEARMTPAMRELFKQNVRIMWTPEDGGYSIKPSWEHVCTAILDRIKVLYHQAQNITCCTVHNCCRYSYKTVDLHYEVCKVY